MNSFIKSVSIMVAVIIAGVLLGYGIDTVIITPVAEGVAESIIEHTTDTTREASEKPSVATETSTHTEVLTTTESTTEGQRKATESTFYDWVDLGVFKVTAYCPCTKCSGNYGRTTATGATARAGYTVAVDPAVIPYGTEVIIDNHVYRAQDCGGGVKGNHIDIFFDTHEEVINFGVQHKEVHIWDEQK